MEKQKIINELKKIICGKDEKIEEMLACFLAEGHIIMEDVPGTGKTTLAKAFSKVFDLKPSRLQFTADVMPSDITGYITYDISTKTNKTVLGPIFNCNVFLADEINRASAKSQAALLEVMEERHATISGKQFDVENPFMVIGTMNPYVSPLFGISLLPQSQLDRFMIAMEIGYPNDEASIEMLISRNKGEEARQIVAVSSKEEILEAKRNIFNVHVDDSIFDYIHRLASETRKDKMIETGISPRTEINLMNLAKTVAYLEGRDYVIPEDIQKYFIDATIHKITLKDDDSFQIISKERRDILLNILKNVPMPRIIK